MRIKLRMNKKGLKSHPAKLQGQSCPCRQVKRRSRFSTPGYHHNSGGTAVGQRLLRTMASYCTRKGNTSKYSIILQVSWFMPLRCCSGASFPQVAKELGNLKNNSFKFVAPLLRYLSNSFRKVERTLKGQCNEIVVEMRLWNSRLGLN
jgi:hypothetical protein